MLCNQDIAFPRSNLCPHLDYFAVSVSQPCPAQSCLMKAWKEQKLAAIPKLLETAHCGDIWAAMLSSHLMDGADGAALRAHRNHCMMVHLNVATAYAQLLRFRHFSARFHMKKLESEVVRIEAVPFVRCTVFGPKRVQMPAPDAYLFGHLSRCAAS